MESEEVSRTDWKDSCGCTRYNIPLHCATTTERTAVETMATTTEEETIVVAPTLTRVDVEDVTVHPLVLLSAADHYHRVARGTRKRAVGVLLGTVSRGAVDATNSFAVPFEEDSRNPVSTNNLIRNQG